MKNVILAIALVFLLASTSYAMLIDNSDITVFGTVYNQYVPANTADDNLDTFWHGTNNIQTGMVNYLAYHFSSPYNVTQMNFYDNYTNDYNMGELDIQTSDNSTNGLDGSWTTISHVAGDFNPSNGDWTKLVNSSFTNWVRFNMTYQGRAAFGGSPAFYLSEVDFYGNAVPEPATMALLGIGLLGAGLTKRRKK